jgi:hypothetical protein
MDKEKIGAAIVNAADKDYAGFKDNIGPELETAVGDAVATKSAEIRQNIFGNPPVAEEEEEDLSGEE